MYRRMDATQQDQVPTLHHVQIDAGGLNFHVVLAGPDDGPPVVLLHGFPETWLAWRHQIPILAAAGYRVIVPEQRGYGGSSKPTATRAYTRQRLAADVVAIARALGHRRFALVGHDWGGVVAWEVAQTFPDAVSRLVVLNAPQAEVMRRSLMRSPLQLLRSWYVFFFQLPWLPELFAKAWHSAAFWTLLVHQGGAAAFTPAVRASYIRAWEQPGAWTGMINWYRANLTARPAKARKGPITAPTRVLWGRRDAYLGIALAHASVRRCTDAALSIVDDAGHFVQHDKPAWVNAALLEFLAAAPTHAAAPHRPRTSSAPASPSAAHA